MARARIGLPLVLALLIGVAMVIVGRHYGSFVAGGADSYAHVSEAKLW
jgi:membrane-associated phospholipid phosphatase